MKPLITVRRSSRLERATEEFSYSEIKQLPQGAMIAQVLGVDYVHLRTPDAGDFYLTQYGMPIYDLIRPENWYESDWFSQHRTKLAGTSTVYFVPTREIGGKSVDLVVKYCRVGQDVPLETSVIHKILDADFNSPFEEFALVEELRRGDFGPPELSIGLQVPLSIYVPPERMQLWQTGRSEAKIASKIARHPGIEIDILRDYILMYAWIHGWDAVEAYDKGFLSHEELLALTKRANDELKKKGFLVLDMKPKHIIVRPDNDDLLVSHPDSEHTEYSLIDFELLQRTPEHDEQVKAARRAEYLVRQRDRHTPKNIPVPEHLTQVSIFSKDYIFGHAESTGGCLWVVGKDPGLFDYFLPERWRKTHSYRLSPETDVFYTRTKDNIHLVWKVSRVGEQPDCGQTENLRGQILGYGFNSPFEEFAISMRLRQRGVKTIYPRAIYRTGHRLGAAAPIADESRFKSHGGIRTPTDEPILKEAHDYITIWGYWNGPDEMLADRDYGYYKSINAAQAHQLGWVSAPVMQGLIERQHWRLASAGVEALNLKQDHLLLSLDPKGVLLTDEDGLPEARLCNFQLLRIVGK
ncbi:MAG TPA: hypothetical protein VGP72_32885 [Planctomycetota bacterium]|jgi:hypothetical protein